MPRDNRQTILIADDDAGACETLADVLASEGFIVKTVADGRAAIEAAQREHFDVAFIDQRMPGATGLEVIEALRGSRACRRVYLLTAYAERDFAARAIAQGAHHVFVKPLDLSAILQMLRADLRSDERPGRIREERERYAAFRAEGLTPRETQVLALIAQGKHNREIAGELMLSPRTVERHVGKILAQLEVPSRAAAAAVAIRDHLV